MLKAKNNYNVYVSTTSGACTKSSALGPKKKQAISCNMDTLRTVAQNGAKMLKQSKAQNSRNAKQPVAL